MLRITSIVLACLFFTSGAEARWHYRYHARAVESGAIVASLAAIAQDIASGCGSTIISGVRHTYVAGTNRISCHASGQAVDMSGNPSCIYQKLQNWPGGYSTDYGRMGHVHISSCMAEWGAHFQHGGGYHWRRHYRRR
jgi:hypothetical protein